MTLPTPPVALSVTYLSMLQSRQQNAAPPIETPARERKDPAPSLNSTGRGRLLDILV
jgi:hypothetical protein